jgi:hypothetical protein
MYANILLLVPCFTLFEEFWPVVFCLPLLPSPRGSWVCLHVCRCRCCCSHCQALLAARLPLGARLQHLCNVWCLPFLRLTLLLLPPAGQAPLAARLQALGWGRDAAPVVAKGPAKSIQVSVWVSLCFGWCVCVWGRDVDPVVAEGPAKSIQVRGVCV